MKLKSPHNTPDGGFTFFWKDAEGTTRRVVGAGLVDLRNKAAAVLKANNIKFDPDELPLIVETQICLRQVEPKDACWMSGAGDTIHHELVKPFLKKVQSLVDAKPSRSKISKLISSGIRAVTGCGGCSGTKVFDPKADNLGRAGKLNKLLPKK